MLWQHLLESFDSWSVSVEMSRHVEGRAAVSREPKGGMLDETLGLEEHVDLHAGRHLIVERLDVLPLLAQTESRNDDRQRTRHIRRGAPGPLLQPFYEADAGTIYNDVGYEGRNEFTPQPVALDLAAPTVPQRRREIQQQPVDQLRIVRQIAFKQFLIQNQLRVGAQDGQFRPRKTPTGCFALRQCLIVGQELDRAIQPSRSFQTPNEPHMPGQQSRRTRFRQAQRATLQIVMRKHERRDLIGHLAEQCVALLESEFSSVDSSVQQDLDVHLMIGGVDAGGIVDEVRINATASQRVLNAS